MRIVKLLLPMLLTLIATTAVAQVPCLFFSEYVEGSSLNKAVEIFNATGGDVDLSLVAVQLYTNGSSTVSNSVALSGILASGDVFVLANPGANPDILAVADLTSSAVANFTGDDAVALVYDGVMTDVIGQIGLDPGSAWGVAPVITMNATLRRMSSVCCGDSVGSDAFDPAPEFEGFPTDDSSDLGMHTADCVVSTQTRSLDSLKSLFR